MTKEVAISRKQLALNQQRQKRGCGGVLMALIASLPGVVIVVAIIVLIALDSAQ